MSKKIMRFNSLEEEMEFWDTHDATEFEAKEVTAEEILGELRKMRETLRIELDEEVAKKVCEVAK